MKKIISALLSTLIMCSTLFMAGCDGYTLHTFWNIMGLTCENHDYPDLYDEELQTIVYNGNAYYEKGLLYSGLCLADYNIPVGRTVNMYGGCLLWYKSEEDVNTDILYHRSSSSIYLKECAILPETIYDCQFSSMTLYRYNVKEVTLENEVFAYPLKLEDLLEFAPQSDVDYKYQKIDIKAEIVGYPYLTTSIDIYTYNDDIYLRPNDYTQEHWKVKEEYQEIFKNAVAEFPPYEVETSEGVES